MPYAPGTAGYSRSGYAQPIQLSRLMIVETTEGEVTVNPQSVRRVEFLEGEIKDTFSKKSKSVEFEVQMDAPAGGKKLTSVLIFLPNYYLLFVCPRAKAAPLFDKPIVPTTWPFSNSR